jgi:ferredoxin
MADDHGEAAVHRVEVEDSDLSYFCRESDSVLIAMARTGRRGIPLGCTRGGCGVCVVQVVAGRWKKLFPMTRAMVSEEAEQGGRVLACCIAPETELRIRVIGKLSKNVTGALVSRVDL